MTKPTKQPKHKKLVTLVQSPDGDRASTTSNRLSEHEFDLVTYEDAVEAAAYWRNHTEFLRQSLTMALGMTVCSATELLHELAKGELPVPTMNVLMEFGNKLIQDVTSIVNRQPPERLND